MKFLNEMYSLGAYGDSLANYDRAIDMINSAVEHHEQNDNFDAIADIDSLVQFIQGKNHDFTSALEQTVRDIIADEMGSDQSFDEEEEFRGGGKFHRAAQGPEFRGGGVRKRGPNYSYTKGNNKHRNALVKAALPSTKDEEEESFADRVSRYKETKSLRGPSRRSRPVGTEQVDWNEEEEFRGGGKFNRGTQGPEFRGGGVRKKESFADRDQIRKDRMRRKYDRSIRRSIGTEQEEQEIDNWTVDWDDEVKKFRNEPDRKRVRTRRSPPNGTSVWNTVMSRAEQEEVDDTLNQRRSKRFNHDVSRTGTMRRIDPNAPFIPDVRHGEGDHRQSDPRRKHARLMARKARPHVEQEEDSVDWNKEEDSVDWNKEVRDFRKRRKTYEPKYARQPSRLRTRRRNAPTSSVFSVKFESFKQFNEMYRDSQHGLTIDLSGPDGNAFFLLGYARSLAKQLDKNPDTIIKDMQYSDYDHLLDVFEREFGSVITFINRSGEDMVKSKDSYGQSDVREPIQDGNKVTPSSRRD